MERAVHEGAQYAEPPSAYRRAHERSTVAKDFFESLAIPSYSISTPRRRAGRDVSWNAGIIVGLTVIVFSAEAVVTRSEARVQLVRPGALAERLAEHRRGAGRRRRFRQLGAHPGGRRLIRLRLGLGAAELRDANDRTALSRGLGKVVGRGRKGTQKMGTMDSRQRAL